MEEQTHTNTSASQDPDDDTPEIPGSPDNASDAVAAIRDALVGYKDEREDHKSPTDDSKTVSVEAARRWHKAHKDTDRQARRRK